MATPMVRVSLPVTERHGTCQHCDVKTTWGVDSQKGPSGIHKAVSTYLPCSVRFRPPWRDRRNHHPTVKPFELTRWLVRLVTPPGGTVLDPFAGSGTTDVTGGFCTR